MKPLNKEFSTTNCINTKQAHRRVHRREVFHTVPLFQRVHCQTFNMLLSLFIIQLVNLSTTMHGNGTTNMLVTNAAHLWTHGGKQVQSLVHMCKCMLCCTTMNEFYAPTHVNTQ